jgi:O-antigen/teichoic acid export membrane protein
MLFKLKAQVDMFATAVSSLLSLGLAVSGYGIWALVYGLISNFILRIFILAIKNPWLVWPTFNFVKVQPLFYYGGVITLSGVVFVLSQRSVNLIAGPVLGAEQLGYFVVAAEFAILTMSKVMPILNQTMFPAYSKLDNNKSLAATFLLKSIEYAALIMFPMTIGIACVASEFVEIVFGERWNAIALPLAILASMTPFRIVAQVCNPALNALGHAKSVLIIHFITLVLFSIAAYCARDSGIIAITYSWMILIPCITIITLIFAKNHIGITFIGVSNVLKPAVFSSVLMAVVLVGLDFCISFNSGVYQLFVKIFLGIIVYISTVYVFFRPLTVEFIKHVRHRG